MMRSGGRISPNGHHVPAEPGLQGVQDPARLATEGALWGSVKAHGFLSDTVILSDDAGQFNVGRESGARVKWMFTTKRARLRLARACPDAAKASKPL